MSVVKGYISVTKQLKSDKNVHKIENQWQFNENFPCVISMKNDNAVVSKSMDWHHVIKFKLKCYKYRHLTS
jgi:hypothetical protein